MKKLSFLVGCTAFAVALVFFINGCGSSSSSSSSATTYAGPGSHYTFNFSGSTFTINKYTNRSSTSADFTVTGTFTDISTTGFKRLEVGSVTGSGGPTVGSVAYGLEIPGIALFIKPLASGSNQVLAAMASGNCPTSTLNANWIIIKRKSSDDMSGVNTDTYGTFTYSPTTGVASLPAKYSLANTGTSLGSNTFSSASCSNGLMAVSNGGGDNAVMYLTSAGAALVNTAETSSTDSQFILGFPSGAVTVAGLAKSYAGILFSESDGTEKIKPITMTLTSAGGGTQLAGTGTKLTDIVAGTTNSEQATLSLTAINSPSNGFMTGSLTAGSTTTNLTCMAVENINSSGKNVVNCAGRDPGDSTKLFNFLLIQK